MSVVPAGVHVAVCGGEGKARVLPHLQGIVVGPDPKRLSGFFAPDKGDDSPSPLSVKDFIDAHGLKVVKDEFFGLRRIKTELGNLVESPPPLHDPALQSLGFFFY